MIDYLSYKLKALIWKIRFAIAPVKQIGDILVKEIDRGLYVVKILDPK